MILSQRSSEEWASRVQEYVKDLKYFNSLRSLRNFLILEYAGDWMKMETLTDCASG